MFKTEPIRDLTKVKEMQDYLKEKNFRDYCMFVIGTNVGFRISDLLEFKVGTFRGQERIVIKEDKTGKIRRQKIPRDLRSFVEEVTEGMDDDAYLFRSRQKKIKSNERGKPISRIQAYLILKDAAAACGLGHITVGTHTLRKTFGYHHYKQYKDLAFLQKLFGHSSPTITLEYIGLDQEEMDNRLEDFSVGL